MYAEVLARAPCVQIAVGAQQAYEVQEAYVLEHAVQG